MMRRKCDLCQTITTDTTKHPIIKMNADNPVGQIELCEDCDARRVY
jgi:hypothetical protein